MDIKTRSGNFSRIELDDRTREFWKVGQKGLRDGKEERKDKKMTVSLGGPVSIS